MQSAQEVWGAAGQVREVTGCKNTDPEDLPRQPSFGDRRRHNMEDGEGDGEADYGARRDRLHIYRGVGGLRRAKGRRWPSHVAQSIVHIRMDNSQIHQFDAMACSTNRLRSIV